MKRIVLGLVLILALFFLSNAQPLEMAANSDPSGFLFHFFGTLCLLALLDVNARKFFTMVRQMFHLFFHPHHTAHHQTP